MDNGLVYRYRGDDGLPGQEGAFLFCTFWLVEILALSGQLDEAQEIFSGVVGRASPLGLLAEQMDARTGEHLGNFPQAFSHVGLINALLAIACAQDRTIPGGAPMGAREYEDWPL